MLLINFTGAPGAGKSTIAAALFYQLKMRKWNVELVTEYTKELILTDDQWNLADELLVFSEKYRRIKKMSSVDIVITDSPLINSVVYGEKQFGPAASAFYEEVARGFDSLYFAISRTVPYVPLGRMPDEAAAEEAGEGIIENVKRIKAPMWMARGDEQGLPGMLGIVEREAARRSIERLMPYSVPLKIDHAPVPLTQVAQRLDKE